MNCPMRKKQFIILSLVIIAVIGLPLTFFLYSKQQELRSRAEKSSILYFAPESNETAPLSTQIGNTLPLDIMLNPGTNAVSLVKLELLYDPAKFEADTATAFEPNLTAFSQVVDAPQVTPGKITVTLSIGTDLSKVLTQVTKVGTLKLKALSSTNVSETPATVSHGPNSQILAIGANTTSDENVLSNTTPAFITINQAPIPTCAPKPVCLDATPPCLIPEPVGGWCAPSPTPTQIPVPTIAKCPNAATDSLVIIDKSGSMNDRIGTSRVTKIANAKTAANNFVDILSKDTRNKIGLVSFDNKAYLKSPLTDNYAQIKTFITALNAGGYTCHQCAINKANQELMANGRPNIKKVAILLTDGKANWIEGGITRVSQSVAEQKAIESIKNTSIPNHIVYYTIGLGNEVNSTFLKQIASETGGKYYYSPTSEDLQGIYEEISLVLAKGSISGTVFNDVNKNGIFDQDEPRLEDWTLIHQTLNPVSTQSIKSDESGEFNIGNLCDGSYTLKEVLQPGWTQTVPVNPNEYTITVTGGAAVTDKNFGNYHEEPTPTPIPPTPTPTLCPMPTPIYCPNGTRVQISPLPDACSQQYTCVPFTPTPAIDTPTPAAGTRLLINGLLDGIGARGDNSNPDGKMSNKDPRNTTRNVKVSLYNASNQIVADIVGTMIYSSTSGSFIGNIPITQVITSGNYTVKATTDNHLTRMLGGIQQINEGQETKLPDIFFTAGDIVHDNAIDIRDYNQLIGCYSDLAPATACDDQKKLSSDMNDDGSVNQFDYNLFLREIATQPGQ